ncbi:MAG: ATP-grasp domain-containing protein [Planctomycetota bacterium]|jgi:hypothetical protein
MAITRRIGLSLGADICWPQCFEGIFERWNPTLRMGGEDVRFEVERVSIEPFDLLQPVKYDVVVDRLTHWYKNTREWIKKGILLDDMYVFNNPWSVQSMEKQTTYCAMMRLGMPIPKTWMIPPKEYEETADLEPTLSQYARLFDLDTIGKSVGYPLFMKPYDGGGWVGVSRIEDTDELQKAYEESGKLLMHLQSGVSPYDEFVRCVGIGPQVRTMRYVPDAPLHARYGDDADHLPEADLEHLRRVTLTINAFFGWDFNSCESLSKGGVWHPIDYANPCPDSQVTSLHRHFPWLVIAKMRWAFFCAATGRRFRRTLDWEPFYRVADEDMTYAEKLEAYGRIADERFETTRFEEFCAEQCADLDEIAWEFFGSDRAKAAVRQKVEALYPDHEIDEFTERFWSAIQDWRSETSLEAGR